MTDMKNLLNSMQGYSQDFKHIISNLITERFSKINEADPSDLTRLMELQNIYSDLKFVENEKEIILDKAQPELYNSIHKQFSNFEQMYRESVNNAIVQKMNPSDINKNKIINPINLIQSLINYCDNNFKKRNGCNGHCNHPSGKCSGNCADCLREIQYHHGDGRAEYNCCNMLRYYACHTVWKRCSEILYALGTLDLQKYSEFNILSIGCGAAPDLMAFEQIADTKKVLYHGIDIEPKWKEIHDFIMHETQKIELLFDEIINKLIVGKTCGSPLLLIINDIDHKSWICDYFNLFMKKLRKHGLSFKADKRHFEPRENGENAGSKLYKSRTNQFLSLIPPEHRDKYNANTACSAAQLIIEVT